MICNITKEIRGKEYLKDDAIIYACKHQSAWETVMFYYYLSMPAYVLKRELTWIPFFGWYTRAVGAIAVNRSAGASALKAMLKDVKQRLQRGQPIIFFPEGTRVPPGESRDIQPGMLAIYKFANTPVVPVSLNSGEYWGKNAWIKRPGKIIMQFHTPIQPGMDPEDFKAQLEEKLSTPIT